MAKDWVRCVACSHGTDIKPEEPFIELLVLVHDSQYMGVHVADNKPIRLLACPKCGTVRMEL